MHLVKKMVGRKCEGARLSGRGREGRGRVRERKEGEEEGAGEGGRERERKREKGGRGRGRVGEGGWESKRMRKRKTQSTAYSIQTVLAVNDHKIVVERHCPGCLPVSTLQPSCGDNPACFES